MSTELQLSITKANLAVEKAQRDYDNLLAKISNLEAEYSKDYKQKNPTASFVDIDQYLKTTLQINYENLALEKQNLALEKQNLARKEDAQQELLKQQTIILQRDQNQGISSY
jgi:hypothetical protein